MFHVPCSHCRDKNIFKGSQRAAKSRRTRSDKRSCKAFRYEKCLWKDSFSPSAPHCGIPGTIIIKNNIRRRMGREEPPDNNSDGRGGNYCARREWIDAAEKLSSVESEGIFWLTKLFFGLRSSVSKFPPGRLEELISVAVQRRVRKRKYQDITAI